jgi:pseudaminic acid synthase
MRRSIQIGDRMIGSDHRPFIIAEMSGNHNRSLERALAIVEAAAAAKADAVKLQTFTADTMTLDMATGAFVINDPDSLWNNENLYGLYEKAHTPWEWHEVIFDRCRELGLICLSTPFDHTAVDFLEELGAPAYKIASPENVDLPLIRKVARTGKPVLISTGMASVAEIEEAVGAARNGGCSEIVLLKCTTAYPASPEDSNVATLPHMRELFDVEVGLSDHTLGIGAAVASIALGASVIEKHLTIGQADLGVDAAFSLRQDEFTALVRESEGAWQALGRVKYGPTEGEKAVLKFRRSLYVVCDMVAGEKLGPENVRAIRPGLGLPPRYLDVVMGKRVNRSIRKGTALSWDLIG